MPTSTVTSKGQTTIPKEIRARWRLKPGDRLEFLMGKDGRVTVLPATLDAADLAGTLKAPSKAVTVDAMNQAIRKRWVRLVERAGP